MQLKTICVQLLFFTENRWGKAQRNLYVKQLDEAFLMLAQSPDIGISCDYIREGYRKFPQGSHIIYYKHSMRDIILVVRILHKSMDCDSHF